MLEDNQDLIYFFEDLFRLKKESLNKILCNAVLNYAIVPALINSMNLQEKGPTFI